MTTNSRTILFFSGFGILVFAVGRYFYLQKKLLDQNDFKFKTFRINKVNKNIIDLNIVLELINNSDINAVCEAFYLEVFLDTEKIGVIQREEEFVYPAKSSIEVDLSSVFQTGYIISNAVDIIFNLIDKKEIKLRIEGYAKIKSGFISATIPINNEKVITL